MYLSFVKGGGTSQNMGNSIFCWCKPLFNSLLKPVVKMMFKKKNH